MSKQNLSRIITKKTASQINQAIGRGERVEDISAMTGARVEAIENYLDNSARERSTLSPVPQVDPQTPAEALDELETIADDDKAGLVMLAARHGIEISTRKNAENFRADLRAGLEELAEVDE